MKGLAIVGFGATAIAAVELPIDDFAKLGVAGCCLSIVWWIVARTLPQMQESHQQSLATVTAAYRETVAEMRDTHTETTDRLCTHLDRVESAIVEAAKSEMALLRSSLHGHGG